MAIKHAFNNPKSDSGDTTITRPSDWNADHIEGSFLSLAGWTALGTLDISNVTDFPGYWHGKRTTVSTHECVGLYQAVPSIPFTVDLTIASVVANAGNPIIGLMLLDSTPTALTTFAEVNNSGYGYWYDIFTANWSNVTTRGTTTDHNIVATATHTGNVSIRMVVHSSTDVDLYVSQTGKLFTLYHSAWNPGFTIANVGIVIGATNGVATVEAVIDKPKFS